MSDILMRKSDHIAMVLSGEVNARSIAAGFDAVRLEHCALPELSLANIDLSTTFLNRKLSAPFLISAMTGGPQSAAAINAHLAEAAEALGVAMAVGSQRAALEGRGAHGFGPDLRRRAPTIPLFANIGAAQVGDGRDVAHLERAVEMIEADALVVHLNPLQEALQTRGDTDWRGVEDALTRCVDVLSVPLIVKEVGFGISGSVARRLADCGVAAIDVAGAGGTSWSAVEGALAPMPDGQAMGELFRDWGIPTAEALCGARDAAPETPLIASGGVRHGLDAAKAIALGASLVGQAGPVLHAAVKGANAVIEHFRAMEQALRLACFACGAARPTELSRSVRIVS